MNQHIQQPSVVVLGGGTGTYTVLSSLRDKPVRLTALLTMVDDGGSNRVLRDEFGLLPASGVRQAMVALSRNRSLLRKLFMYRFHQGNGISGMTFGNLFIAAVADIVGSQQKAIEETCKLLSVKGKILPISTDDVRLVATYEDGTEVVGEHLIDEPAHDGKLKITGLHTQPQATISKEADEAIRNADFIILGPGDFFTNTIANMVVKGVPQALKESKGKIIFIGNLMTKYGETIGFTAKTFIEELLKFIPAERLSTILINSDTSFPTDALEIYAKEDSIPVADDLDTMQLPSSVQILRVPVLSHLEAETVKGDVLKRSIIRHDQDKLAAVLEGVLVV